MAIAAKPNPANCEKLGRPVPILEQIAIVDTPGY